MNLTPSAVTVAVIPVAGFGTRRLPVSKAIEKCMLPVCNRPIVDYSVEACIAAGITNIIFVVSPEHEQLESYYSSNPPLERYLVQKNKTDELVSIQNVPQGVTLHYVVQEPAGKYGTAVPIWLVRDLIKSDEQFLVLMGDDFLYSPMEPGRDIKRLINDVQTSSAAAGLVVADVGPEQIAKYAAVETEHANGFEWFKQMVEKPAPGTAKSTVANISKYLFSPGIFPYIEEVIQTPNERGEHYLTDAVNEFVHAGDHVVVTRAEGQYLDGGNLENWITANNIVYQDLRAR